MALAELSKFLRDVERAAGPLGDAHADVRVVRVEDIGAMVRLEFRLVHEEVFGLIHVVHLGDVLAGRAPLDSGPGNARGRHAAIRTLVTEEPFAGHIQRVLQGDGGKPRIPLKGIRAAFCFAQRRRGDAVAVDQIQHAHFVPVRDPVSAILERGTYSIL